MSLWEREVNVRTQSSKQKNAGQKDEDQGECNAIFLSSIFLFRVFRSFCVFRFLLAFDCVEQLLMNPAETAV